MEGIRKPHEILALLLEHGEWYTSAIELEQYHPRIDGEELAREAVKSLAEFDKETQK